MAHEVETRSADGHRPEQDADPIEDVAQRVESKRPAIAVDHPLMQGTDNVQNVLR